MIRMLLLPSRSLEYQCEYRCTEYEYDQPDEWTLCMVV
jgi:hypothetical protein